MYFTTPEAGFYHLAYDAEEVYKRMIPIAGARFAIGNRISADLPRRIGRRRPSSKISGAPRRSSDGLGVLPAPFPLHELLSEDSIRHIFLIFGMKGLSYGNMSARERIPELGGHDVLDDGPRESTKPGSRKSARTSCSSAGSTTVRKESWSAFLPITIRGRASRSMPSSTSSSTGHFPRSARSSTSTPGSTASSAPARTIPCGTVELAEEVVHMLKRTDCPGRTAVGLKNHGLTITGPCLDEIFGRIQGRLRTEVQMMA